MDSVLADGGMKGSEYELEFDWTPSNSQWVRDFDMELYGSSFAIEVQENGTPFSAEGKIYLLSAVPPTIEVPSIPTTSSLVTTRTASTTSTTSELLPEGTSSEAMSSLSLPPSEQGSPQASSSSNATPQYQQPHSALGKGAIAGIAIGCTCFGMLLGIVILCLLRKKRQKRRHISTSYGSEAAQNENAKASSKICFEISGSDAVSPLRCYSEPMSALSTASTTAVAESQKRRQSLSRIHEMPFDAGICDSLVQDGQLANDPAISKHSETRNP